MIALLALLVGGYLLLVTFVAVFQRHLIYLPSRGSEERVLGIAQAQGLVPWRNEAGEIVGWRNREPRTGAEARILVLHGNAGFALHRNYFREALEHVDGGRRWEVILLEYPGYGARAGTPGEAAFRDAAQAAFRQLQAEDARPIYLLGESIGAGAACALAAGPDPVAGLMLIAPFNRMADVASRHYPWLPVRMLLRDRFDNEEALARYGGPVAILLAGSDEIAPADLGRRLHASTRGPSLLREQPEATHNALDLSPASSWWTEASAFLFDHRE